MMENHHKKHADEHEMDFVAGEEKMWTFPQVKLFPYSYNLYS